MSSASDPKSKTTSFVFLEKSESFVKIMVFFLFLLYINLLSEFFFIKKLLILKENYIFKVIMNFANKIEESNIMFEQDNVEPLEEDIIFAILGFFLFLSLLQKIFIFMCSNNYTF